MVDDGTPEIIHDTEACTRRTILLVEDDRDIRDTVAMILEQCGYRVIAAGNGQEALDAVAGEDLQPSLIILDWMMPVMGGLEFLERHGDSDLLHDVPVLVLSAVDRVFNLSGANVAATMTKPVRMRTLIEVIDRLCGLPRRDAGFLTGKVRGAVPPRGRELAADPDDVDRTARTRAPTLALRRPTR